MRFDGFEWDDGNWPKCARHGLTKAEIESVLQRGVRVFDDPNSSADERRYSGIGRSTNGRMVFVVFCYRRYPGGTLIRPISARYMHRREIDRYDQLQERP